MTEPGALIAGRYRVVSQLGAGGMGVVWEARDERLARPVAVKELRIQPGSTEAESDLSVQRAMREARINARLHHPYAVSVFDVVQHEGKPCIVMELVPSVPLSEVMRELGALEPSEAARVGSQVADALGSAHALGIVHRDVKPGNVLIGDDGTARICDFGISRSSGDATLTVTGMITGTPAYLSPEAARGEESTSASDVYSLGATLYAAVEGEPPFGADGNPMAVLYRVVAGELRPPQRAGALGPLLVAMMNLDPQQRPTMAEVATQLSALAVGRSAAPTSIAAPMSSTPAPDGAPAPAGASPPATAMAPATTRVADPGGIVAAPPTERRRRPGLIVAVAVLIVAAGVAAVALLLPELTQPTTGSEPSPAATRTGGAEPTGTPAEEDPAGEPTAEELAEAVTGYYGLLPDDTDAAWELLTPSYQRQTGGRDSYEDFWKDIDTVAVTDVEATVPNRVEATLTYVAKSGGRESTERRSFQLVRSDGVLKINQSAVL